MLRLVISNQRGGVGKTTTVLTLARLYADAGSRVLLIDTDPQGSISILLGLKTEGRTLHNFLVKQHVFTDCLVSPHPMIDVLMSSRDTLATESVLQNQTGRELAFKNVFPLVDASYDVVLIDVAPSISLLQTCAMTYTEKLLIPISMDPLSLSGAAASLQTAKLLNSIYRVDIRAVALLPVIVDRRLQITEVVLNSITKTSEEYGVPILPSIRIDASVTKAARQRQFIQDFDPNCRALEDYKVAFTALNSVLEAPAHALRQTGA